MDTIKVKIDAEGQAVVTRSIPAEQHCADIARALAALADVLTVPAGLQHLSNCTESDQQEMFALLRSLSREQAVLADALQQHQRAASNSGVSRKSFYPPLKASGSHEDLVMRDSAATAPHGFAELSKPESALGH